MGHSRDLLPKGEVSYVGTTWTITRFNHYIRHVKSPGHMKKRLAKIGGKTMQGIWCRHTGTWYRDMRDSDEYREVMVRSVKTRSQILRNLSKMRKVRRVLFPMRMETVLEEPDVFRSLFGKTEAENQKEEEVEDKKVKEVIEGEIGNHFVKYVKGVYYPQMRRRASAYTFNGL